jgi:NAD(P)-dependent dehydrogenase (short-subunit alcohol dehydrogenase family)
MVDAGPPFGPLGALAGRRLLVVGASSGIGRAAALAAGAAGASVALAARRVEQLCEAAVQAAAGGAPAYPLACDVTEADAARALPARAASVLGGLDAVVYAAGVAHLVPVAETSAEQWHRILDTNLVGAAMVAAGALEPLRASAAAGGPRPVLALVSSQAAVRSWPGVVAYASSKAALEALGRGLRREEPWLRVLTVVVNNTVTGFADAWDPAATGRAFARWQAEGDTDGSLSTAEETAAGVLAALADEQGPDEVSLAGPPPGPEPPTPSHPGG